jgi:membrane protein YdbS with pleckstrin-like domain
MVNALPKVWRKSIFVFVASSWTPLLQLVLSLLIAIFCPPLLRALAGISITFLTALGIAAAICGVWTTIHFLRHATKPAVKNGDKTALARRQVLYTRLAAPIRWLLAIFIGLFSIGITLTLFAAAFAPVEDSRLIGMLVLSYYAILFLWLLFEWVDWQNDQFILTEDAIIDINRFPLVYSERNEAPLEKVQTATTSQPGIWSRILDYGNVQVETAGGGQPIIFESVWNPEEIREMIFHQIDVLARKKRESERKSQAEQTQRWFEAYHTLTGGIRNIRYDKTVEIGRSAFVLWRVEGPSQRPYGTWLVWDIVSHADDARPYVGRKEATRSGPARRDEYAAWIDWPPTGNRSIYFRVVVEFFGERRVYSSPEMAITIRPPARV